MTTKTVSGKAGNKNSFVPDAGLRNDIDFVANFAGGMAGAAVLSVFVAWGLNFHPLSSGWGYFFGLPFFIGILGSMRRDTYRSLKEARRAMDLSLATAIVALILIVAVWGALFYRYMVS